MPSIEPFYELNTEGAKRVDQVGDQERVARKAAMDLLWRYYDGDHDEMLKPKLGKRNDNVTINLVGQAVDDTVDYVAVPEKFEIPGVDEVQAVRGDLVKVVNEPQERLNAVYKQHRQMMRDAVQSLLLAGHAFCKVMIDDDGAMFDVIDPRMVTAFTDAFNPRKVVFYRLQWVVKPEGSNSKEIVMRQDIVPAWAIEASPNAEATVAAMRAAPRQTRTGDAVTWVIIDSRREGNSGAWQVQAVDWWGYETPPMMGKPVKRKAFGYYGQAPFENANKLNDTYNLTMGNVGRILYWHAHPKTFFSGVTKDQIQETSVDGAIALPQGTTAFNVEMRSDLVSSMNYAQAIRGAFFTKSQVVDSSGIGDKVGQLTNFGLRLLYNQMSDMADKIREAAGALFGDALRAVLATEGILLNETPRALWPDTLPENRLEMLQGLQIESGLGIASKQSLAETAGRDYEVEQDRQREEQQTAGEVLAGVLAAVGERGGDPFSGNGTGA